MFKRLYALGALAGILTIVSAACGGGGEAPTAPRPPAPPPTATTAPSIPPTAVSTEAPGQPAGSVVNVSLEDPGGSGSYAFNPAEFTFGVGETVTIVLSSEEEFHTFTVDDLGIDVGVDPGATEELAYTFEEAGTFRLI